jgi:hypothetical protein
VPIISLMCSMENIKHISKIYIPYTIRGPYEALRGERNATLFLLSYDLDPLLVGEHVGHAVQRKERLGEREGEAIVTLSAVVGRGEKIRRQGKKE